MSNELFTADLEVRLRSTEAILLLRRFRMARKAAGVATIAMLDRDVMKQYGQNLVVIEPAEGGEFAFLYAGAQVPDDAGTPLGAKTTGAIGKEASELYRLGCREASLANDAICVNHQSGPQATVHRWECLFLPITDAEGRPILVALCIPREYKHEFFRAVLDAMPQGAFVAEPVRDAHNEIVDARIIAANARGIEICGCPDLDALQGRSVTAAMGNAAPLGPWDRHLAVLRSGKGQSFDHHHRSETGSHWYQMHATPLRDGLLVSVVDITEMKQGLLEIEHQRKMLLDEMEQRRGLEQELWALAHLDPLTALPNRRAFRDSALLKLAEAQTAHRPCALITIDIDHFKRINDAFGHGAGDAVLRRVADIIKAPLRPNTDIAARMGGEEFSILLPDTDSEAAIAFAEKLRRRIEQTSVVTGDHEIQCTISLGIALNRKTSSLDDLINRADRALYTAKRSGRNKVATELDVTAGPKGTIAAA